MQIFNGIRFLAGGVSELINSYLHAIGLTSAHITVVKALSTLSTCVACDLQKYMAIHKDNLIGSSICIDNLDIDERVHTQLIGNRTMMFHRTWGYIHIPSPSLMKMLNNLQLTLNAYYTTLRNIPSMKITPSTFLPSQDDNIHWEAVLHSQIAQVMRHYIGPPENNESFIPCSAPPIELIYWAKLLIPSFNNWASNQRSSAPGFKSWMGI